MPLSQLDQSGIVEPFDFSSRSTAIVPPRGTTGQRPSSPTVGMLRFNTTTSCYETYTGSAWFTLGYQGPAFSYQHTSFQTITSGVNLLLNYQTLEFDTNGCYNNSGSTVTLNGISTPAWSYAPNVPGYYMFIATSRGGPSGTAQYSIALYKNGVVWHEVNLNTNGSNDPGTMGTFLASANGTSDYFQIYINENGSGSAVASTNTGNTSGSKNMFFQGYMVRGL